MVYVPVDIKHEVSHSCFFLTFIWVRLVQAFFCLMSIRCWFRLFVLMLFKKDKDRMAVFDFVSAWVSDKSNFVNLELDCMDVSLDVGGAHRGTQDVHHKVACISKVCMVNSEMCHGMDLSEFARVNEKAVYNNRVGESRRWRKDIFKAKPQI